MASSKNLSDKRLIDAHEDSHHHCSAIRYRKENNEQHEKGKQQCSVTKIFNPQFALIPGWAVRGRALSGSSSHPPGRARNRRHSAHSPNRILENIKYSDVAHGFMGRQFSHDRGWGSDLLSCASGGTLSCEPRVSLATRSQDSGVPQVKETHLLNQKAASSLRITPDSPYSFSPPSPPHPTLHLLLLRPSHQALSSRLWTGPVADTLPSASQNLGTAPLPPRPGLRRRERTKGLGGGAGAEWGTEAPVVCNPGPRRQLGHRGAPPYRIWVPVPPLGERGAAEGPGSLASSGRVPGRWRWLSPRLDGGARSEERVGALPPPPSPLPLLLPPPPLQPLHFSRSRSPSPSCPAPSPGASARPASLLPLTPPTSLPSLRLHPGSEVGGDLVAALSPSGQMPARLTVTSNCRRVWAAPRPTECARRAAGEYRVTTRVGRYAHLAYLLARSKYDIV
ncbi:hypothetical protein EI555_007558 [Monodon monoceros]|uniref:Uncharacterized protein n=1 Tax=Monodon monoceros TaxID=40151 RepID=A0A4U1FT72_MONMO|nr:hypothetical protein EI555_007558 [Monodon monoceros]